MKREASQRRAKKLTISKRKKGGKMDVERIPMTHEERCKITELKELQ